MLPALKWQMKTNSQILMFFCSRWKKKEAPTLLVSKLPFLSLLLAFSRWLNISRNISMSRSLNVLTSQFFNRSMFQCRCLVLSTTQYLWMCISLGVSISGLDWNILSMFSWSAALLEEGRHQRSSRARAEQLCFEDTNIKKKNGFKIQKFLIRDHCDCSSIFHLR